MNSSFFKLVIAIALAVMPSPSSAQQISPSHYDLIEEIQTIELQDYLKKSKLAPLVKVRVTVGPVSGGKPSQQEDLFTCREGLLGRELHKKIDFTEKRIAMRVKFSSSTPSVAEVNACAAVLPALLLDQLANGNFAGNVYVPRPSFQAVKASLSARGFLSASQVLKSKKGFVAIQLQSEPQGQFESLMFSGSLRE